MDHRAELSCEREEGREEGHRLALRHILEQQITRRFGPLSPVALGKLHEADGDRLAAWVMKVLEASTVEQIFAEPQPGPASP